MKRKEAAQVFFATLVLIGLSVATDAIATVPNCSTVTPVTESCGWVISTPGCYKLQNSLTATTDAGDCIQINSSNVFLDLNTQTITGTGSTSTGTGVHVLAATNPGGVAISNVAIQGGADITGFQNGVVVGNPGNPVGPPFPTGVRLDNITAQNNSAVGFYLFNARLSKLNGLSESGAGQSTGLGIEGGSGNKVSNSTFSANGFGVEVFNSSGNVFSAVAASSNSAYGFLITDVSTANQINASFADSNAGAGIAMLNRGNGNSINGGHANSNGSDSPPGFGVWIMQSTGNQISGISLRDNLTAGIYLGCNGPTTGTCTTGVMGNPMSNSNGIDANVSVTGSPYGIAIDKGNLNNTVVGNRFTGNSTLDEYDGNKCGVSTWFANNFGTSNASCVH